jgi:hypothetical protein
MVEVHEWPMTSGEHPVRRLVGRIVFILWCASWFPSIIICQGESTDRTRNEALAPIKLICALNAASFLFGGSASLVWKARSVGAGRLIVVGIGFLMLSSLGPVVLPAFGSMLRPDWRDPGTRGP